jgi:hypothetical protein
MSNNTGVTCVGDLMWFIKRPLGDLPQSDRTRVVRGVGRQFSMLAHPTRKGGWRDLVAVAGFQFGCSRGKGIAEVIERDAIKNDP